jgi:hypothetical protein
MRKMITLSARRWIVLSVSHGYSTQSNGESALKRKRHVSHEAVGRNLGIRKAGSLFAGYHQILKHDAVENMFIAQPAQVTVQS